MDKQYLNLLELLEEAAKLMALFEHKAEQEISERIRAFRKNVDREVARILGDSPDILN